MVEKMLELLSYNNPVFRNYAFWCSILIIKTAIMSFITMIQRHLTKTFSNPEDINNDDFDVKFGDERVERIRRAHLNDLENILPFILISFIYTLTDPMPSVAINLFRVAAGARIWHTFVYVIWILPQPSRLFGFLIPTGIMIYMAVMCALFFVN